MLINRILQEKNIFLKDIEEENITENYVSWLNDPEVNKFLETRFISWNEQKIRSYIQSIKANAHAVLLAIFFEKQHIGNLKLELTNPTHRIVTISLFIGDKNFWGRGIATAVINRAVHYVFIEGRWAEKIVAGMYQENIASLKTFLKAGFNVEGVFKDHYFLNGQQRTNLIQVGMSLSEYNLRDKNGV